MEIGDAYSLAERPGGKRGRGEAGKTSFVAPVETMPGGKPDRVKSWPLSGISNLARSALNKCRPCRSCSVAGDWVIVRTRPVFIGSS
jgi:hypothetical protein